MTKRLTLILGFLFGWLAGHVVAGPELAPPPRALTPDAQALAFPPLAGTYRVLALGATDGDTLKVAFLVEDSVRMLGYNSPEMHALNPKPGQAAKDFLASKLSLKPMRLTVHGREKYGRLLGVLYDEAGDSINDLVIKAGHGKPYDGTGPRP